MKVPLNNLKWVETPTRKKKSDNKNNESNQERQHAKVTCDQD